MHIHFWRHATLLLEYNGITLLLDPMLSPMGAMEPVGNAADTRRIPLVDLPLSDNALHHLLGTLDGVLVTHTHRDHWDGRAVELLPKTLPILCQPASELTIRNSGFTSVMPIQTEQVWHGITIHRTGGQHGTGDIGQQMGIVSGFVLEAADEPTLYIAGDTIWCAEVAQALEHYQPDKIILNAGAAQFLTGDPITMTAEDVACVCQAMPNAQIIAVHMDTINHCQLTRTALADYLKDKRPMAGVAIPVDGDTI